MRNPYRVEVTPDKQVNILLTSRKERQLRTYPHIVKPEEAAQFADRLEQALADGHFTDLECCPLCGQPFARQNRLCLMKNGAVIHKKCLRKAVLQDKMLYQDCKDYRYRYFPRELPSFDFSNLTYEAISSQFRYAFQTVSRTVVHLYLIAPGEYTRRHTCLTCEECCGLIREIREKLKELETMEP